MSRFPRTRVALAGLVLATAVLGACSDDDEEASTGDTTETSAPSTIGAPATTEAPTTDAPPTTAGEDAVLEIAGIDYAFGGVPESIAAGTEIKLVNQSETELHELVAVRLPDEETRSVDELVTTDMGAVFGAGEPALVVLAEPGSDEQIVAVGDGTLTEPGRYVVICMIPEGADPAEYMAAAAESEGGPPSVPGGPPHAMHGMYAEVVVS
jgi:hypothetical protein